MESFDQLKSFHTAAALLPERLWRAAYSLTEEQRLHCEELRIRIGRPLSATVDGVTVLPGDCVIPVKAELDELLARATEASVHTYLEQLRQGFLTTRNGHRLGLCAQAPEGRNRTLRGISSVNLRIARQIPGLGKGIPLAGEHGYENTLIAGTPGAGKTTLLRELCADLSGKYRVAIADERYEIAACMNGEPRFSVGLCDVLSGGRKSETLPMLLRAMSPQILAVDEIAIREDCEALLECAGCGCGLLATVHGDSVAELRARPLYRDLLKSGIFRRVIVIRREGGARRYQLLPLNAG